jgi:hypothetical protein
VLPQLLSSSVCVRSLPPGKDRSVCLQDYRTAFCINCGANTDVSRLKSSLGADAKQFVRLVFIDSNRPIHHSLNDDNDNSLVLLHDPDCGDVPLNCIPVSDAAVDENTGALSMLTVIWIDRLAPFHALKVLCYLQARQLLEGG